MYVHFMHCVVALASLHGQKTLRNVPSSCFGDGETLLPGDSLTVLMVKVCMETECMFTSHSTWNPTRLAIQ